MLAPLSKHHSSCVDPIRYDGTLHLLDQRKLPHEQVYLSYEDAAACAAAIKDMVVRGAPAIGITAAYGIVLEAKQQLKQNQGPLNLHTAFDTLARSRPTAVNLFWALTKMKGTLKRHQQASPSAQLLALESQAIEIHQQDISNNQRMAELGAAFIQKNSQVYTHCNAGALATGGYGTALGVIRWAHQQGRIDMVYAGETRPWLQGARLTCWELMQDKIAVTLCTEGAAGQLLRQGNISWIIVGADRIAANGDVANKIGTYNLAILAKHHGVKLMVVAPTSTFDLTLADGNQIPIENRPVHEVTQLQQQPITPINCHAINPSFDVTPHELIDVLICERGAIEKPNGEKIQQLFSY